MALFSENIKFKLLTNDF